MQFASVNGVTLHYRLTSLGENKPVMVFSNSLGTDFRIWDELVAAFGHDYQVLCYDKRGHGLSETGEAPYQLEDHSSDLAALMDHLGLAEAVAVGLSVGGMIVQDLAAKRPDLVKLLVLCDTAHKIGTEEMWQERISQLEEGGLGPMVDPIMERWFTADFRRADNPLYVGCVQMLSRQGFEGYVGTCHALRDADLTGSSAKLQMPTLCLVGDQDGSTPPEMVKETADLIPNSSFAIIEKAGHIPCVEQPASQIKVMNEFLQQNGLPGGQV
ncbi:3-oxoadipate enol-lactonase [Sneathiella sp. P13V-1]|uniref:3-oxoadipate enol-lactonase n=1 Tax=Sneathiella sp. P13V-1 TaxID=2697366 RepID=UPI00187B7275|nr:3-oxoadipate enol-lactonase [Sneathiella sp. P13V-1]MBE7636796.1 3-oxoadipate enol-lactonase [Sneathiella sp. P13V-1]